MYSHIITFTKTPTAGTFAGTAITGQTLRVHASSLPTYVAGMEKDPTISDVIVAALRP